MGGREENKIGMRSYETLYLGETRLKHVYFCLFAEEVMCDYLNQLLVWDLKVLQSVLRISLIPKSVKFAC